VFVGYDFSASSDAALRWVASLTQIGNCHVTVAYVSWPPKETWRFGIGGHPPFRENDLIVRTLLERDLKERWAQTLGKGRSRLRVIADWGPVDEKLIELAKAQAADLIVLGTNQRQGLSRYWLGSVSRGVLHHAPMNVVCVPATDERKPAAERIPTHRRVLVPTDFSKQGNRAISFAYGAAPRGGEVCLVHVVSPTGGFRPEAEVKDGAKAKRKRELTSRLEALVPEDARSREIRSRVEIVEHQHPDAAIGQAAERFAADLICIGSRGHSGLKRKLLGSVTERLMRRSGRPVLVIRE
jgi:nucleotide-binding universal stress UspA family protein